MPFLWSKGHRSWRGCLEQRQQVTVQYKKRDHWEEESQQWSSEEQKRHSGYQSWREEGGVGQNLWQNNEQTLPPPPGRTNLHPWRFSDLARHKHRAPDWRRNSEGSQMLKNSRLPEDHITAEMLKCSMHTCVTYWKKLLCNHLYNNKITFRMASQYTCEALQEGRCHAL